MKAVVLGSGTWGTGFARLLADRDVEVTLASHRADDARAIAETGRNPRYSSSVDLAGIASTTIADASVADADVVVVAVPSRVFRTVVAALDGDAPVLSLTKGLDPETGERLSTLVRGRPVAMLSGPNMAEEVAAGLPAAAVIASEDEALAESLQAMLNSLVFRVYVNSDLIGVELCAAAKNVIALA
ncbi:MAG: NAD(P)-binding domain-containing protein, partial [Actinobacteria bacterium]|nr:NAD(P)-binding domain-containing protein [Actinomycetota bacterium]